MNKEFADYFASRGLSSAESERKAELLNRTSNFLGSWVGAESSTWVRCYVPGRIEVLGKHTDYAGGRSLLCAVERGICAMAAPRHDHVIRIADVIRRQECQFVASPELDPQSVNWAIYPKTVARRIARNFPGADCGMDMAFASDLPRASGMSSSSALLIATYVLLERFNQLRVRPEYLSNIRNLEDLATFLGCVENGQSFGAFQGDSGVGTFGGSEDHIAILCSKAGELRQYKFCPARFERAIPFAAEVVFAIAVSGVAADKTGNAREKYNFASLAAQEILKIWRAASGRNDATLFEAATHSVDAPDRIRELLRNTKTSAYSSQALLDRFGQFHEESTRIVPGAAQALAAKDMEAFGQFVDQSQALAEQKLGNQIPQTIELASSARSLGALAASAFGAGFGGSVWAVIASEQATSFLDRWQNHYRQRFPIDADSSTFFISGAGPATFVF
ncbi:MAG TPA: galactokinase family protein [Candidatus Acidoferrum sp.]|nr:galactokinase family protein [Candidatus Acidoferrum sp.]